MPHAFLLPLSPTNHNTKPKDLSLYAHGLFYHLLEQIDPTLSKTVHEVKRNPFTLHATQPRDEVLLRITVLDDTLFQPLLHAVLYQSLSGLELGRDHFQITKVVATPEGSPEANYCSWEKLLAAPETDRLNLRFTSPTVFTRSREDGKRHFVPLPEPYLILQSLLSSFQSYSPQPYSKEEIAEFKKIFEQHVFIASHKIYTQDYDAGRQTFTGFLGSVTLRYPDKMMQVNKLLGQLGALAFYSGVGAKTPYGMGQVKVVAHGPAY
jgi:CRISPR-associated endoribonuclease Cas6